MTEYLRVKLAREDYLAKDWSGSAGVKEIIVTDTNIAGDEYGTTLDGYIIASIDEHNNLYLSTDLPEPFKLRGDESLKDRVSSFEAENFDDVEDKLNKEFEDEARVQMQEQIVAEYEAELEANEQSFAQTFIMSGARDLDEFYARTKDFHSGLSDEGEQRVVDDINRYETLQSRRRAVVREIDKAYDRNDRNTDRDVSNLTFEREVIVRDMNYINQRYRIDEINELRGTDLQVSDSWGKSVSDLDVIAGGESPDNGLGERDTDSNEGPDLTGGDPVKPSPKPNKPSNDFEVHNLPGVSEDDFKQAVSDFRNPITEDNVDEFMTELSLLQDEGLRLDM